MPTLHHDHPEKHEDRSKELDRRSGTDTETVDRPVERHIHDHKVDTEECESQKTAPGCKGTAEVRERDEEERRDDRPGLGNPRR